MQTNPTTNEGRALARGNFSDYECGRTTNRRRVARKILAAAGAEYTVLDHDEMCGRHPDALASVLHGYRDSVCCALICPVRQGGHWPEWVDGPMLDAAAALADATVTASGRYNRTKLPA